MTEPVDAAVLRAVVFEHAGDRRIGRLDDDVIVDGGPAGDGGFVPTPGAWDRLRAADGDRFAGSTVRWCAPVRLDLAALELTTVVNGDEVQHASTGEMIHSVVDLVEYLSSGMTLEPGDVIATGTPAGVGNRHRPPRYLREGDVVEVRVSHVGTLSNPVTIESQDQAW